MPILREFTKTEIHIKSIEERVGKICMDSLILIVSKTNNGDSYCGLAIYKSLDKQRIIVERPVYTLKPFIDSTRGVYFVNENVSMRHHLRYIREIISGKADIIKYLESKPKLKYHIGWIDKLWNKYPYNFPSFRTCIVE